MGTFLGYIIILAIVALFVIGVSLANSAGGIDELMNEKKRLEKAKSNQ